MIDGNYECSVISIDDCSPRSSPRGWSYKPYESNLFNFSMLADQSISFNRSCIVMIDHHDTWSHIRKHKASHIRNVGRRTYGNIDINDRLISTRTTQNHTSSVVQFWHQPYAFDANTATTNIGRRTYENIGRRTYRNIGRRAYGHTGRRTYENKSIQTLQKKGTAHG